MNVCLSLLFVPEDIVAEEDMRYAFMSNRTGVSWRELWRE
jgi:hypothetical protein